MDGLQAVRTVLADGPIGDDAGLVIAGRSGTGRTTALQNALGVLETRGHATTEIYGVSTATDSPFAVALPLLGTVTPSQTAIVSVVRRWQERDATGPRPVVGVDDAHLLDRFTAALLHQLVRHAGVFVVATVLDEPCPPDYVTEIWNGLPTRWVDVPPLSLVEIIEVVSELLGGPVSGDTALYVQANTAGVARWVNEYTRMAIDERAFVRGSEGLWTLDDEPRVSTRWRHLVSAGEPRWQRSETVLRYLAIARGPLPISMLEALTSSDDVEDALTGGLVCLDRGQATTCIQLRRPWEGVATRRELTEQCAARLTAELVDAVMADDRSTDTALLRAISWLRAAGLPVPATAISRAADVACRFGLGTLAVELAARSQAGAAHAGLAHAYMQAKRSDQADRTYDAITMTDDVADPAHTLDRAMNHFLNAGRTATAAELVEDALQHIPADSVAARSVQALRASFALTVGDVRAALEIVGQGVPDRPELIDVKAIALLWNGRPLSARVVAGSLGPPSDDQAPFAVTLPVRTHVEIVATLADAYGGALQTARTHARRGYQAALDAMDVMGQALWSFTLGLVELLRGRLHTAERALLEAHTLMLSVQTGLGTAGHVLCLARLAEVRVHLGRLAEAEETIAMAVATAGDADTVPAIDLARAALAEARGDLPTARRWYRTVEERSSRAGSLLHAAAALVGLARLGDEDRAAEAFADLAPRMEGDLLDAWHGYVRAMAANDERELSKVSDALGALDLRLLQSTALRRQAEVLAHDGQMGRAALAEATQRQTRSELGAHELPGDPAPIALTARQLEIALLVASGRSSADVARALSLSVRTVEAHLQAAYVALGIHNRRELSALEPVLRTHAAPLGSAVGPDRGSASDPRMRVAVSQSP